MKRLFPLCALAALILCCAISASSHGTPSAPAGPPAPQSVTLDLSSFGAVGDGVTDDGPALQRALDALADAGGGTLTVPHGRFAILTPVAKDFRGKAANVTIRGVPSVIDPDPHASPEKLTIGLGLVSEFIVKTGPDADALTIIGLDTFLITDIVFIGTPEAEVDARITLGLFAIRDAVVRHCEFYGLSTQTSGGAVLHALESGLTLDKSVFLGSTGSSAHRIPVVQNVTWKNFVMTQTIFADYGQRPDYYGKLTVAPFSWVMLGNPAPTDNLSPRREASIRNVFFDEGGFTGVASFPDYYDPSSRPPDLVHISDFRMNVSSLGSSGIYIYRGARNVLIERGEFMLSTNATSAVELVNAGDVILDELTCGDDADTIRADAATRRLTVINSTYNHLHSQAQSTKVISSADPDKDPVQYVRQRFLSTLAREADPAANYFWADLILRCDDAAACTAARKNELSAYLATSPNPSFSVSGRATKDDGSGLSGVSVNLSGSQTVAAAADASGDYIFAGLPTSGDYTLTPGRINYTFTPASQTVSRPAGDRTVNFPGKANRRRITGRLATAAGAPVVGATVALSGTETATATTDANGNYSLGVGAEGSYTVTPTRVNYTFAPTSRSFTNVVADQTADFAGTPASFTISGRVTDAAAGLPGVTVTLSGSMAATRTTDATGNYSFTAIAEGNYTVTAARTHYTFTPPSVAINNLPGNRTANFAATLNRHAIRGKITNASGAPLAGVSVTLSGAQTATATTDSSGNYALTNLPAAGNYTVTPARQNYAFTPATRTVNALSSDQTADFTGALVSYTITGRVTSAGANLPGTTVTLSGSQTGTTTTGADGLYSFTVTAGGNYTVTPSRTHYTFTPASTAFNNLSANAAADFAGAPVSYQISGRVTSNGAGLAGVTLNLAGSQTRMTTADASGNYSFSVTAGGNYTVTPSRAHHTFAPASATFNNLSANAAADFAATLVNYRISGRVTAGGVALSGATVTLSGSSAGTATTDAAGNYAFDVKAEGDYTITPSHPRYNFAPLARTFNKLSGPQAADFAGTLKTYTVSGRVTNINNTGIPGTTVTLSGTSAGTATTDASGLYSFPGLPVGGAYTVTPALAHHDMTPASRTIANLESDQSADFVASFTKYKINGRVTKDGSGLAGVSVVLSGSQTGTATTDADGNYSFTVTARGNYTVTPTRANHAFTPASRAFDDLISDQSADFAGALVSYQISGRVTSNGAGLAGATLNLAGSQTAQTTTAADGAYSFTVTAEGSYTVTPSLTHYVFTSASAAFNNLSANAAADFAASPVSYQLSGRVTTSGGVALAGATLTLSGSSSNAATTDAAGLYSFNVPALGNYTVTPTHPRHDFAPTARTFNDLAGPQAADFAGTLKTYTVSGRVTNINNTGIPGTTVTLSGTSAGTATTDASGLYSFPGLPVGGAYTVTPALAHHDMTPASRTIANLESDQTADFVASFVNYTIRGRFTENGNALSGVTVTLSGSQSGTATTDADGNYSFTVTARGNYTVTPARQNYAFTSASRAFDDLVSDQTADFTGALVSYQISGRVTDAAGGLAGVSVTLSGSQSATKTTDAAGNYAFTVTAEGSYTVTPSLTHYVFTSASAAFNNLSANAAADFAGALVNYKITGRVTDEGAPLSGVTVTLSGARTGTATTDAAGAFSFLGLPALGNYTVTPTLANHDFNTPSRTVFNLDSDQTADFTAKRRLLISFGAAAYSASEAAGSITITVVRTGDISAAAEVVCSAVNGSAEQRTDLTPIIGTISFAPGEATKSVRIFITDDAYLEATEQLTLMLSGAVGGTLTEPSAATLTIADNDAAPQAANPIDDAQFFVRQHYRDFLGREPDAAGLAFWSNQILSCGADAGCVDNKRINVSAAFFLAIEFQETGYFVHRLYKAAYARAPRHVEEFLLDSRQVGGGLVVNAPGWQQLLEDNKADFARVFVERPTFTTAYPLTLTPAEFVGRLNERAGSPLTQAQMGAAVVEFAGAATSADAAARARALRLVVESDVLRRRELNAAFVLMQYLGYMQRNPDEAPEPGLNFDGYNFWLRKLNEFGGDFHAAQMVRSFLVSGEYRARFGR